MSLAAEVELIGMLVALGLAEFARRRRTWPLVGFWVAMSLLATWIMAGLWLTLPLAVGLCWLSWSRWQHRTGQSTVARWRRISARNDGMAGRWQLLRHTSPWAIRRQASTLRPTFKALTRWERWRVPITEYALPLTRVGWWRMWLSVEEMVVQFGRPRRGKTGQLIHWVLDAPGALIVTSTKVDLYYLTRFFRSRRGSVWIFNPTQIGKLVSTIAFNPLVGCEDPETAEERAIDLISGGAERSHGEGRRWDQQAQRVLTGLLHAAALGGHSMTDVLVWVADPDAAARKVMALMRCSPAAAAFVPSAEQFCGTNSRTRTSVTFTIMPALEWLTNSKATAATQGATQFDVETFLAEKATLYLMARRDSRMGPLLSALTGYIAREARRIAAERPGGRLDPILRLVLDEAANICPVPLDEWSSDFGSHGLQLCPTFQSYQQVVDRWGHSGAGTIANNTGALVLHATGLAREDLDRYVALSGFRIDHEGRRVPVLSVDQLMNLPKGTTVVWGPDTPLTIGRMRPGWHRRDLREANHLEGIQTQKLVAAMEDELDQAERDDVQVLTGDR
ncbi:MAG: TraM recognition domain-containing protein [Actinomycetota bacterium]|nr:TraM recognition domain-containing protein [Actinomycetota bacterium]